MKGPWVEGPERNPGTGVPVGIRSESEVETFKVEAAVQGRGLLVNEAPFFELEVEELLQGTGTAAVLAVRGVVLAAVGDDPLQVSHKELPGHIVTAAQAIRHGLQVWGSRAEGHDFRRPRKVGQRGCVAP